MPLDPTNFYPRGPVKSTDMRQYYDLFTGSMVDQPVTFRNMATVGGNQGITTVPFKVYGAPGQNTNLIDLYPDRSSAQPGFGFSALGSFGWGPGGTAPQDSFLSRIGHQHGHVDDTPGVLVVPRLEVDGSLEVDDLAVFGANVNVAGTMTAGSLQVTGGGLGTIGATQINFSPSAFIRAYGGDNTYIELPKLTVTPGPTSLAGVTVNGTTQMNGAAAVTGGLTISNGLNVASGSLTVPAGNLSAGGTLSISTSGSFGTSLYAATTVQAGGRGIFNGYDAGAGWGMNVGGNGISSGFWYQRANAGARCYDTLDFTYTVAANASTLVQRDGAGQVQVAGVYLPTGAQGGKPTYVIGQTGDGYMRWWPASAIGPPPLIYGGASDCNGNWGGGNGGWRQVVLGGQYNNGIWGFFSGNYISAPRSGYYSIGGRAFPNDQHGLAAGFRLNGMPRAITAGTTTAEAFAQGNNNNSKAEIGWSCLIFMNQGESCYIEAYQSWGVANSSMWISFIPTLDYPGN